MSCVAGVPGLLEVTIAGAGGAGRLGAVRSGDVGVGLVVLAMQGAPLPLAGSNIGTAFASMQGAGLGAGGAVRRAGLICAALQGAPPPLLALGAPTQTRSSSDSELPMST